jgi:hypothetical protein
MKKIIKESNIEKVSKIEDEQLQSSSKALLKVTSLLSRPDSDEIERNLIKFTGTTAYYQYSQLFSYLVLTDGTKYLAKAARCYWLFDQIASLQLHPKIRTHSQLKAIQFWRLHRSQENSGVLSCEWDKGQVVYEEKIRCTDFPLKQILLYVQPVSLNPGKCRIAHGWVCFLPSEY